jgi:hypothetical protein
MGWHGGPRAPPGESPDRRHPSPFDRSGGTASSRSARKGRPRGLCRTCSATQSAGAFASSDRSGGTASPPSAGISGTEDCAPPTGSVGRDRVLAVRKERQTTGASTEPATKPDGRVPLRARQVGRDGVAAVRKNIGPRGLCPSHKVPWEGPRPRGPQGRADQGRLCRTCNHTRWLGALANPARSGRDGVPPVRKNVGHRGLCPSRKVPWEGPRPRGPQGKAEYGRLYGTCNDTRWPDALANPARSGRDGVPPVRNNTGHRGLCPSRKVPWEGPRPHGPQEYRPRRIMPLPRHSHGAWDRAESAKPGWAASWRSARKGRPRAPLRNLKPHPMAGCPCEPRQVGEGRRPPVRNNTGHRGLCPSHRVGWEGPRPRGPQEKADPGARAEPAARLNRRMPLRSPTGWEVRRPRRPQEYWA